MPAGASAREVAHELAPKVHVGRSGFRPAGLTKHLGQRIEEHLRLVPLERDRNARATERISPRPLANLRDEPRRGGVRAEQQQVGELDRLVDAHPWFGTDREGNGHGAETLAKGSGGRAASLAGRRARPGAARPPERPERVLTQNGPSWGPVCGG